MDKKLHLLDSFEKVMAYEHLLRVDLVADGQDHWESTGLSEYRLGSGERVDVARDGAMRIHSTGVELRPARSDKAPGASKLPTR
jgi:hypothetical protein